MATIHIPVLIPGWIDIEVEGADGKDYDVTSVEVAPDEAELRTGSTAFKTDDADELGNLTVEESRTILASLNNDSFMDVSLDIYT